jgi:hypothetical protein
MTIWKLTINGGVIVPLAGIAYAAFQPSYWLGIAGWVVAIFAFVSYSRSDIRSQ